MLRHSPTYQFLACKKLNDAAKRGLAAMKSGYNPSYMPSKKEENKTVNKRIRFKPVEIRF